GDPVVAEPMRLGQACLRGRGCCIGHHQEAEIHRALSSPYALVPYVLVALVALGAASCPAGILSRARDEVPHALLERILERIALIARHTKPPRVAREEALVERLAAGERRTRYIPG